MIHCNELACESEHGSFALSVHIYLIHNTSHVSKRIDIGYIPALVRLNYLIKTQADLAMVNRPFWEASKVLCDAFQCNCNFQ